MSDKLSFFTELFALWPTNSRITADTELARDMGVPRNRARQWINRGWLAPWYWPRFVEVLDAKFKRTITYRQLVEATAAERGQGILSGARRSAETRRQKRDGDGQSEAA